MAADSVTGTGHGAVDPPIRGLGPIHKILQANKIIPAFYVDGQDVVTQQTCGGGLEPCEVSLVDGTEVGLVEGTEVGLVEGTQVQPLDENEEVFKSTDMNIRQISLLEQILLQMQIMNTHLASITGEEILTPEVQK